MIDILIENGSILSSGGWIEKGYLTISGDKITALEAGQASLEPGQSVGQSISAEGMAVLPGLTNAHTHLSQTFMRGLAAGRSLVHWLEEVVWPLQDHMAVEELYLASLLGLVENLHSGVTRVVDHQKITKNRDYSLAVIAAAEQAGLHLTLARAWADRGPRAEDSQAILADLASLFEQFSGSPRVQIASGPLAPWRVTADTLQKTHSLAQSHGGVTHMHVSETRDEPQRCLQATGMRPLAWLDSLGVLGPDFQVVHGIWLDPYEIFILQKQGARVIHCPTSNAVLGSGIAPISAMLQAGISIRLGTDGAASNDTQDCFENMKMGLCLGRLHDRNPAWLTPAHILNMGTAGESLAVGAPADLMLVNLNSISAAPVHDLDSALVLSSRSSDVDTVIVGGKVLMRQKRVTFLDEGHLIKECQQASTNLLKRAHLN